MSFSAFNLSLCVPVWSLLWLSGWLFGSTPRMQFISLAVAWQFYVCVCLFIVCAVLGVNCFEILPFSKYKWEKVITHGNVKVDAFAV